MTVEGGLLGVSYSFISWYFSPTCFVRGYKREVVTIVKDLCLRRGYIPGANWYMEGLIDIDRMITRKLPLNEINTAFDLMHEGQGIRTVIEY
jgi:Zn-dependent alcohol dehydrogenase